MRSRGEGRLGEDVSDVRVGLNVEQLADALGDPVANHVVLHVDMLSPGVVHGVLCDTASSDVVNPGADGQDDGQELVEEIAEVQTLSASFRSGDVFGLSRRCRDGGLLGAQEVDEGAVKKYSTTREGLSVLYSY